MRQIARFRPGDIGKKIEYPQREKFKRCDQMAEHKHGEMDISVQEATFEGFVSWVVRATIAILVFLVLLAMING